MLIKIENMGIDIEKIENWNPRKLEKIQKLKSLYKKDKM